MHGGKRGKLQRKASHFTSALIITLLSVLLPIGSKAARDVFRRKYPLDMKQLVALLPPFPAFVTCRDMRNEKIKDKFINLANQHACHSRPCLRDPRFLHPTLTRRTMV